MEFYINKKKSLLWLCLFKLLQLGSDKPVLIKYLEPEFGI